MPVRYNHKTTLTGATPVWDATNYNWADITEPTTNVAVTLVSPNLSAGVLFFKQDAAGSRTLTINGAAISVNPIALSTTVVGYADNGVSVEYDSNYSVADTIAPTVVSATAIDATTIRIVFSEVVTATNVGHSFKQNGSTLVPSAVSGTGTTTLNFTVPTMLSTDTLLRSYNSATGNTLDAAGNELVSYTDAAITNSIVGGNTFQTTFTGADGSAVVADTGTLIPIGTIAGTRMVNDGAGKGRGNGGNNWLWWESTSKSQITIDIPNVGSPTGDWIIRFYHRSDAARSNCIKYELVHNSGGVFSMSVAQVIADVETGIQVATPAPTTVLDGYKIFIETTDTTVLMRLKDLSGVTQHVATGSHSVPVNTKTALLITDTTLRLDNLTDTAL